EPRRLRASAAVHDHRETPSAIPLKSASAIADIRNYASKCHETLDVRDCSVVPWLEHYQSAVPKIPVVSVSVTSARHTQLSAFVGSPLPLYSAICGKAQSGRWKAIPLAGSSFTYLVAMIRWGAIPCSTHWSRAESTSSEGSDGFGPFKPKILPKAFAPGPPPQWAMPGAMNKR